MPEFDHLAIATRSLKEGAAWLRDRLGIELQPGGRHAQLGTHNMLLSLGPREYLELIAMDPDAAPVQGPGWFGLKGFDAPPQVAGWVLRESPLQVPSATFVADISRGDLRWRITLPETGQMPGNGTVPMRIDWGDGPHPSDGLPDHGVRLSRLEVQCPETLALSLTDPRIRISTGVPRFILRIATPHGEVLL